LPVTVPVIVTACPAVTGLGEAFSVNVDARGEVVTGGGGVVVLVAALTVREIEFDVSGEYTESPEYEPIIVYVPLAKDAVDTDAEPELSVMLPSEVVPDVNVTVPVGVTPLTGATAAVNVTD
jgi:hypothetical protein